MIDLIKMDADGPEGDWLREIDELQAAFDTNPLYWLLHEPIYADGAAGADGATAARCWAPSTMAPALTR